MSRFVLDDTMWMKLQPLLPTYPKGGRPSGDNRLFLEAVCWIVRTGAPWRDLPPDYGHWKSVYNRYSRWVKKGHLDPIMTKNGFQDPSYFTHFVPLLADVWTNYQEALKSFSFPDHIPSKKRDDTLRKLGEQFINSPLNRGYKNEMNLTKLQIIHLFF